MCFTGQELIVIAFCILVCVVVATHYTLLDHRQKKMYDTNKWCDRASGLMTIAEPISKSQYWCTGTGDPICDRCRHYRCENPKFRAIDPDHCISQGRYVLFESRK
jgi:Na+-transporting NADH:ubiquinone oxidoreductase subunit NqrC